MNKLAIYIQLIPLLLCASSMAFYSPQAQATQATQSAQTMPIVVELFTSKFCPACPNADHNFNQLIAKDPNIIGLSCHVSYFNRNGRGDKLARPFCDARQNVYKLALNTGGIYTPMTIINGSAVTTGIKQNELNPLIQKTKTAKNRPVGFLRNGEYLNISLPQINLPHGADIWLFEIENRPDEENYTHYRNTVKNITKLLRWDGKKLNMAFPAEQKAGISYALIIQTYKGGIIAAAQTGS